MCLQKKMPHVLSNYKQSRLKTGHYKDTTEGSSSAIGKGNYNQKWH